MAEEVIKTTSFISLDSYIKPRLHTLWYLYSTVVYLLTPTSNHNLDCVDNNGNVLYIFWLLHQTTTVTIWNNTLLCCISFDSYIKPQLEIRPPGYGYVVYLLTPTSNHNCSSRNFSFCSVVYLLTPTSNHNRKGIRANGYIVVYLLTPTSNHNVFSYLCFWVMLYIFWLLHQTTTYLICTYTNVGCISFDSYIKPQLIGSSGGCTYVVYLLTPTSNHNAKRVLFIN